MYAASYQPHSERRRAASFALTIVAHVFIIWLLFRLGPLSEPPKPSSSSLSTFSVLPDPAASASRATKTQVAKSKPTLGGAAPQRPAKVTPTPAAPTPPTPVFPEMLGGKELFEAADVGKIPSVRPDKGEGSGKGDAKGAGSDSVAAYGPGEGPGGQRLYDAELVRAPSGSELAFYLKSVPPADSWGEIACQMTADLSLENCRVLGEKPVGSGFGRALRQAAWQFKIRPPRIGRRAIPGTWVRIHLDWNRTSSD
jgi:protein TonB